MSIPSVLWDLVKKCKKRREELIKVTPLLFRGLIVEVIWKFSLQITDRQTVTMPVGANILSVQDQAGGLQLWAIVNPDAEREQRVIEIIGTGNPMVDIEKEDLARFHIATVQVRGGALVWHVFELL